MKKRKKRLMINKLEIMKNCGRIRKTAGVLVLAFGILLPTVSMDKIFVFAENENQTETSDSVDLTDESKDVIEKKEEVVRTIKKGNFQLEVKKYTCTYKFETGRIYQELSYEYPVVSGDSTAAAAINKFYRVRRAAWLKTSRDMTKEAREVVLDGLRENWLSDFDGYYSDDVTLTVTSNDKKYFSIMQQGYEYTLGAHGLPYRECYSFDARTGKRLTSAGLLGLNKKQVNAKVRKLYLKEYDRTEGSENSLFYEYENGRAGLLKAMKGIDFSQDCYIKNGKLYFYAYPYALGPYAAGFIEVALKL